MSVAAAQLSVVLTLPQYQKQNNECYFCIHLVSGAPLMSCCGKVVRYIIYFRVAGFMLRQSTDNEGPLLQYCIVCHLWNKNIYVSINLFLKIYCNKTERRGCPKRHNTGSMQYLDWVISCHDIDLFGTCVADVRVMKSKMIYVCSKMHFCFNIWYIT